MPLTFDDNAGQFRDQHGRFVSPTAVRAVVDQIADGASERMADAARRMLAGDLSLAEWQAEVMRTIKVSHVASATIAHGGAARMGPAEYGAAGRAIRDQYDYLRSFAAQIADGSQPLNGAVVSRAAQYGQQARVVFEREYRRDQQRRGYTSERNVLHPAEHCALCVSESARGWVPIGSLIPIGARTCRGNDRCTIAYSKEAAQAA